MGWTKYILLGLAALTSAGTVMVLVPPIRKIALRRGLVDIPGGRKAHPHPVPLLGGLAIWAAILTTIGLGYLVLSFLGHFPRWVRYFPSYFTWLDRLPLVGSKLGGLLLGATLCFVLGLADDLRKGWLDYRSKFPFQFAIAGLAVAAGIQTQFMPGRILDGVVSVLWIVGIANAFNLLDNMDGLAAGVAAIASGALAILTASQSQDYMAFLLAVLAGASAGFLRYNFHPARIFMGDAGSLTLGFLLGSATILASYIDVRSPTFAPVVIPVLILSVPIFDCLSVLYIRWREHRPLFVGDRRHFSHRLVDFGLSEKNAVLFLYLVEASVAMGALLLPRLSWAGCLIAFLQTVALYALLTILMVSPQRRRNEVSEVASPPNPMGRDGCAH
ncbi:MAG: undecaprenyl/decaprenyl-phosphate alpha-N-acetylglucosaminyl 1-phosphate transferase [candidate division KSB1 bacterium]|nr:undecaprenyl/decaprenyl-phosphate alpha-N-acetylglucosaminyl 1-phosphate transferase [candidate division KSB1 bacterium]